MNKIDIKFQDTARKSNSKLSIYSFSRVRQLRVKCVIRNGGTE